VDSLNI